jgi:hypothetical protein
MTMKLNKFAMAAVLAASAAAASQSQAATIQLNFTGFSYSAGETTFQYDVLLTSASSTPGQVAMFDLSGYVLGSENFTAAAGVSGTVQHELVTSVAHPTFNTLGVADNAGLYNLFVDIATADIGQLSLGTLTFRSTTNAIEPFRADGEYAISVVSNDHKYPEGGAQYTLTSARGPASNGESTTPIPAAAVAGLPLLGMLGLGRRSRK